MSSMAAGEKPTAAPKGISSPAESEESTIARPGLIMYPACAAQWNDV